MKTAVLALAGSTTGPSNSANRFIGMAAGTSLSSWTTTAAIAGSPVAIAGTISALSIRAAVAVSAGTSYTFTLVKNGVDTALTCIIGSASITASDLVHTVAVVAGDLICIKCAPSGTPAAQTVVQAALIFDSTTAGQSVIFSGFNAGTVGAIFANPGALGDSTATTESFQTGEMPTPGTITSMYVSMPTAPGAGASRTITLRKNGADTAVTVTISTAATTGNITGQSIAYVAGDTLSFAQTVTGTPASSKVQIGADWRPTTDGEGLVFGSFTSALSTTASQFGNASGATAGTGTTEAASLNIVPAAATMKLFRASISTAPGAAKTRTFTVRQGTGSGQADTALSVAISGGASTSGTDADTLALTAGDLLNIAATETGTPAAVTFARTSGVIVVTGGAPAINFSPTDVAGQTFEGVRGTSAVVIGGAYSGSPTDVQVQLVDGALTPLTAYVSASTQAGGVYAHTFSGIAVGGAYYHRVRDNGGTATLSAADLYVGAVVVLWGQSQCEKLFTIDTAGLTPTSTNVRVLTTSDKTNAGTAVYTITLLNASTPATPGITGSGVVGIANQWHADVGASVPLLIVFTAYQGTSIEFWLSDRRGDYVNAGSPGTDATTLWGTTPTTGLAWGMANAAKFQASGVMFFQGTSDVGSYAGYATQQSSLKTKFETLYSAMTPLILVAPHPRSDDGANTWNMRSAQYGNAIRGGTWRLCCWLLDWQMDADSSPHQTTGATGNIRGGTRFGRGIAKHLNNTALDVVGPQVSSAAFTDTNRNVIEITYNKTLKLANGTGYTGSPVTLPPQLYAISTNSGANFGDPGSGFTVALTATNKVQITKTATAWLVNTTCFDYLRGTPFSSTVGNVAEFVGTEANMETNYLGKVLTDGTAFESNRGVPASPIMGTGFGVSEAGAAATASASDGDAALFLAMRL